MSQITVTINGIVCKGNAGETILKIATDNGIYIPTLCHHESVAKYGACGLCVVEAEKSPKLMRACATTAADGMVINTNSARVMQARKIAMELLMSDHEGDCVGPCSLNCPAGTDCQGARSANVGEHESYAELFGLHRGSYVNRIHALPSDDFVLVNYFEYIANFYEQSKRNHLHGRR